MSLPGVPDAELRDVASVYVAAVGRGDRRPARAVMHHFDPPLSVGQADWRIRIARKRGLIPPACGSPRLRRSTPLPAEIAAERAAEQRRRTNVAVGRAFTAVRRRHPLMWRSQFRRSMAEVNAELGPLPGGSCDSSAK